MQFRYSRKDLRETFFEALSMFNDALDTDISEENLEMDFFTTDNSVEIYTNFCKKYFPDKYEPQYNTKEAFEDTAAEAFFGGHNYGVLIREDIDFTLGELLHTFLHEISHMYCSCNEIEGGNFFDRYCMGSGVEDGQINAGYAIWREAVADIMADSIISEYTSVNLRMVAPEIRQYYDLLNMSNPASKRAMSLIIVYTVISAEASSSQNWQDLEQSFRSAIDIKDEILLQILQLVYDQIHHRPFWEITPDFVQTLGAMYIELIGLKLFRDGILQEI